jgi:L-serine/L-threonine ammonia-lyase
MVTKLRAAGAYEVIQFGAAWKDADTYLKEHVMPYVSSPRLPTLNHSVGVTPRRKMHHDLHSQLTVTRHILKQSTVHHSTIQISGKATQP